MTARVSAVSQRRDPFSEEVLVIFPFPFTKTRGGVQIERCSSVSGMSHVQFVPGEIYATRGFSPSMSDIPSLKIKALHISGFNSRHETLRCFERMKRMSRAHV